MTDTVYRYAAFISYSHADNVWARWLHRRLESYRVPSRLVGMPGQHGKVPRRIGQCFRDDVELSAASRLSETLQQALRDSRALVVICSPHSATSFWVNEEIRYFRALGRGNEVYAFIVDGEPHADDPAQECFPAALLDSEDGQHASEPLAADARSNRDGKVDAFLKLVAGMLGIGFGQLRQREQRRRNRFMLLTVAASLLIASITGLLAVGAYHARNEAQLKRQQADDLINFMLGDLSDRLLPVGRLDVLDSVVSKVMVYLSDGNPEHLDDAALIQRIRALTAIETIHDSREQVPEGLHVAQLAVRDAQVLLKRHPHDVESQKLYALALFALGDASGDNNEFDIALEKFRQGWEVIGKIKAAGVELKPDDIYLAARFCDDSAVCYYFKGRPDLAAPQYQACADLLAPLISKPQAKSAYLRHYWRCHSAAPSMLAHSGHVDSAVPLFLQIESEVPPLLKNSQDDAVLQQELAGALLSASSTFMAAGWPERAETSSRKAVEIARSLVLIDPSNSFIRGYLGAALAINIKARMLLGMPNEAQVVADEAMQVLESVLQQNPRDVETRQFLIDVHARRADLALARNHDMQVARAEDAAAIALAVGEDDIKVRLTALAAAIEDWEHELQTGSSQAAIKQATAKKALDQLGDPKLELSFFLMHQLKAQHMRYAYTGGDVATADRIYSDLNAANDETMYENTQARHRLCALLAARQGPRCGVIEEWKPATHPVLVSQE